jgi:hypothetical protein
MNIEYFQQCRSLDGWQPIKVHSSSRDLLYTVFVNPWSNSEENICQCEAYMFRGKCKHQEEASMHICGWHELDGIAQTHEQKQYQVCPSCGGPTMFVLENNVRDKKK